MLYKNCIILSNVLGKTNLITTTTKLNMTTRAVPQCRAPRVARLVFFRPKFQDLVFLQP